MTLFSRRTLIIFGSTVTSSLFLKACRTTPSTSSYPLASPVADTFGETIKVGILHSLSGSLAISEKSVVDAERLAIEEINQAGGVLGQQIEAIIEDGNSDPARG